jgi:hypothetical protein
VKSWLKLVGKADWRVPEHWATERSDLLSEVRFGERHPPTPIAKDDHLVYHASGDRRLIAIVEVTSDEPRHDVSKEWEQQWPIVLDIRPVMRVGRVSRGPSTDVLQLSDDLMHESFVPLNPTQYRAAVDAFESGRCSLARSAVLRAVCQSVATGS